MNKLHTETLGNGPDIVLLHGWAMHSGIWQFIAAKLAEEFCVTLIDLPGFGRSKMISDYSTENILKQLCRVAPPKAMWVGWSLGGILATKFALAYPEFVTKLICVASSPRFVRTIGWPGIDIAVLQQFNEQLTNDYEETLIRFLLLQFYGVTLNKTMLRWLNLNLFLYGKPKIETLKTCLSILETEDLREEIINLSCPLLYILGKKDALIPSQVVKSLNKLQGNIRSVVFSKASHALFLTHEDEFLSEVRRFSYE